MHVNVAISIQDQSRPCFSGTPFNIVRSRGDSRTSCHRQVGLSVLALTIQHQVVWMLPIVIFSNQDSLWIWPALSGDNLFSAPKPSQSFSNSNLRHLQHSLDSDCLPVPETFWSSSYSEPLPATPNTTAHSFHPHTSSNTPSKGCSETSASSKGNSETSSNSTLIWTLL